MTHSQPPISEEQRIKSDKKTAQWLLEKFGTLGVVIFYRSRQLGIEFDRRKLLKSQNFPAQVGMGNCHLSAVQDESKRLQMFYSSIFNEDGSMVGDTKPFNFGRFQTLYSCLEEVAKSILFSFENIEKNQNTKFSY